MNPLQELKRFGQSVWYDNLSRVILSSGELKRMLDEYAVTGVTSNPTIFEKAISGTKEYDTEIAALVKKGFSDAAVLEGLFTVDIRTAADILSTVYKETGGMDGFVSIEVRPALARNADETIKEARKLHALIKKPNLMIKVPATAEGIAAIEEMTFEGCNINVTLLFSVKRYEEAAWAYIKGLEKRLKDGKPVAGISSVASFFVSRVDTLADKLLKEQIKKAASNDEKARLEALLGRIAAANAKAAYLKYLDIFEGESFKRLKTHGAAPQRLLWASTGTKDPAYSDIKYVEELIEHGTVNTLPLQTLHAFHNHGRVKATLRNGMNEARATLSELEYLGISYDALTGRLEDEGIKSFADSYDALMRCIGAKKEAILRHKDYVAEYSIVGFESQVARALDSFDETRFSERLLDKDSTLWGGAPSAQRIIKNSLGWLDMPEVMHGRLDEITAFAQEINAAGFRHAVVLGMGGSSLAPLVMRATFGVKKGYPDIIVLDSTDPDALRSVEKKINLSKTLFVVSSKSGSTIEPLSFFEYFYAKVKDLLGERAGENFIAITDAGTPLEGFYRKYSMRRLFTNPSDIGGRYSALSYFGLVPAALCGVDVSKLLWYASRTFLSMQPGIRAVENRGVMLGAALGALAKTGRDKATFFLSKEISTFGLWIEQLIAESTGKDGLGIVPVAGEPIGPPSSYGSDRVFIHIGIGEIEKRVSAQLKRLEEAGHPVLRFELNDPYELGGEFFRWEVAAAAAGYILAINPFDQPDVESAKKLTAARLAKHVPAPSRKRGLKRGTSTNHPFTMPGVCVKDKKAEIYLGKKTAALLKKNGLKKSGPKFALEGFFNLVNGEDYIGVLSYLNPFDKAIVRELLKLQKNIRSGKKSAVQMGYGPRYLHSTGQLHKGGADNGVFLILVHGTKKDTPIPGRAFGFSTLEVSQACGDMEALDAKGRRVALVYLKDPSIKALKAALSLIIDAMKRARSNKFIKRGNLLCTSE